MTDVAARRGLAVLVWAGVIVLFGVLPTHRTLQAVAGDEESLSTVVGHFVEFAVFAVLAAGWLRASTPSWSLVRVAVATLALTAALGGAVELVQGPLPYRDMQLSDFATDVAGGLAGLLVFSCVRLRWASGDRRRTG